MSSSAAFTAGSSSGIASDAIIWPESLPAPLIGRTHSLRPRSASTMMESNRKRIRRLHTTSIELIDVDFNFTEDQYDTFRTFFISELDSGVKSFVLITYELAALDGYYQIVDRLVSFVDGTYSFSQSDGLVVVTGTLIVESEEVSQVIPISPLPTTPAFQMPPPTTITYDDEECRSEINIEFPEIAPYGSTWTIMHGETATGPWEFYFEIVGYNAVTDHINLGNYFTGERWVRILFNGLENSVFLPLAPAVEPPVMSVTNCGPHRSLILQGQSGNATGIVMVAGEANRLSPLNRDELFKLPLFSNAMVEVTNRGEFVLDGNDFTVQDVSVVAITAGSTYSWTRDGTNPTLINGFTGGQQSGATQDQFSGILIARAFKDGCHSPPVYYMIDKVTEQRFTMGAAVTGGTSSVSCVREHFSRLLPDCIETVGRGTCPYPYDDEFMAKAAQQAAAGGGAGFRGDGLCFAGDMSETFVEDVTFLGSDPGTCTDHTVYGGGSMLGSGTYLTLDHVTWSRDNRLDSSPVLFLTFETPQYSGPSADAALITYNTKKNIQGILGVAAAVAGIQEAATYYMNTVVSLEGGWPGAGEAIGQIFLPSKMYFSISRINEFPDP